MEAVTDPNPPKRGRGRPPGSKNKPKMVASMNAGAGTRLVPPTASKDDDFAHQDVDTMLSRQLSMLSWQQQALRNKIMGKTPLGNLDFRAGGKTTDPYDTKELLDLSNSLVRTIEALKKYKEVAKEVAAAMSAEQLLDAAITKIEGQSLPTLNYAIKRLRAKREQLAPVGGLERFAIGHATEEKATDAIASLDA